MSWETLNWAGKQRTDNVAMQCTLFVIANAADPDGVAFRWWKRPDHWWTYLVERTGLARGSIYRVLHKLEELHLIERDSVTPDGGGRPQPVIRLRLDVEYVAQAQSPSETVAVESGALAESPSETEGKSGVSQGDPTESPSETGLSMSPVLKNPLPTQTLPSPGDSPQASEASWPPTGANGEASTPQSPPEPADPRDSPEMQKRWKRFCSTYPDGIIDPPQTETEFFKLTLSEADNCIEGAALYADRCKRRREKPKAAHLFIRKRTYSGLLAEKPNTKRALGFTLVPFNSKRGRAVANLYHMTHIGTPVRCHDEAGLDCYSVPIKPGDQVMAFADVPRQSQWEFYELHTPNCAAWRRFIESSTGKSLAVTVRPSSTRPGIYAPHPWPPRIDGTWSESPEPSATGPPSAPIIPELTEDDVDALTDRLTG